MDSNINPTPPVTPNLVPVQIPQDGRKPKLLILIIPIVLLLIIILCSIYFYTSKNVQPENESADYIGWTTYSNKEYGIEFKYPEGEFKIQEGDTYIELRSIDESKGQKILSYSYDSYATTTTLENYAKVYSRDGQISSSEVNINGTKWLVVKYNDGHIDKKIMLLVKDGNLYKISYYDKDSTLEKMAGSIKLIDSVDLNQQAEQDVASNIDYSGWDTFKSENYGIEFKYPKDDFKISERDNLVVVSDKNVPNDDRSVVFHTRTAKVKTDMLEQEKASLGDRYISSNEENINGTKWLVVKYNNRIVDSDVDRMIMYYMRGDKLYSISFEDRDDVLAKIARSIKILGLKGPELHSYEAKQYYVVDTGYVNLNDRGEHPIKNGQEISVYFNDLTSTVAYYKMTIACDSQIKDIKVLADFKEGNICNIENKLASTTKSVKLKFLGFDSGKDEMHSDIKIEAYKSNNVQVGNTFFYFLSLSPQIAANNSRPVSSNGSYKDILKEFVKYSAEPNTAFYGGYSGNLSFYYPEIWTLKLDGYQITLYDTGKPIMRLKAIYDHGESPNPKVGDLMYEYSIPEETLSIYTFDTDQQKMIDNVKVIKKEEGGTYGMINMIKIPNKDSYILPTGANLSGRIQDFIEVSLLDQKYKDFLEPITKTIAQYPIGEQPTHEDWLSTHLLEISELLKNLK